MATQKCLWDSSHVFESPDDGVSRPLCLTCYHNIYKAVYQKTMSLTDFLSNIKAIKKGHPYVVAIEGYYTGIIAKMAISKLEG